MYGDGDDGNGASHMETWSEATVITVRTVLNLPQKTLRHAQFNAAIIPLPTGPDWHPILAAKGQQSPKSVYGNGLTMLGADIAWLHESHLVGTVNMGFGRE